MGFLSLKCNKMHSHRFPCWMNGGPSKVELNLPLQKFGYVLVLVDELQVVGQTDGQARLIMWPVGTTT